MALSRSQHKSTKITCIYYHQYIDIYKYYRELNFFYHLRLASLAEIVFLDSRTNTHIQQVMMAQMHGRSGAETSSQPTLPGVLTNSINVSTNKQSPKRRRRERETMLKREREAGIERYDLCKSATDKMESWAKCRLWASHPWVKKKTEIALLLQEPVC